jgi:surface polysaccharide O-acyltransferase-like enzyme
MTFMIAVPIFWLFQGPVSQVKVSAKASQTIATIARQTLGVYLIHPMVFFGLDKLAHFTPLSFNPLFSIPILTMLTFLLSALIIYILKKFPYLCWIA